MNDALGATDGLQTYLQVAINIAFKHEDFAELQQWSADYMWSFMPLPSEPGLLSDPQEQRRLATWFARSVWNALPLPGNHFRPRPLHEPGRNDACFCGSGHKYKHCCRKLQDESGAPPINSDALWPLVLQRLSKRALQEAVNAAQIPFAPLAARAIELREEGQLRDAAKLLQRAFDAPFTDHGGDAGWAYDTLCNLYDELEQPKKKARLNDHLITTVPRSTLRSAVYQRLAAMLMDAGLIEQSWQTFQLAQQDAPGDPGLAILEVNLLLAGGQIAEAQQRAGFWLKTLERRGASEFEDVCEFLRQVKQDPDAALLAAAAGMDDGAGDWLQTWVQGVAQRPVVGYAIHTPPVAPDGDESPVSYLQTPKHLQALESRWMTVCAVQKPFSTQMESPSAVDAWQPEVEQRWREFLEQHPDCADSFSILDDVLTAMEELLQRGHPSFERKIRQPLLERAVQLLQASVQAAPEAQLPWVVADNRPALRLLVRAQEQALNLGDVARAKQWVKWLLRLNPNDNHGFRCVVMTDLLIAGEDAQAVALAQRYPNDIQAEISYGVALAQFRLGQLEAATLALRTALQHTPRVPKYLLEATIREPRLYDEGVRLGGDDEAWYYRLATREVWLQSPGAMAWLQKIYRQVWPRDPPKRG